MRILILACNNKPPSAENLHKRTMPLFFSLIKLGKSCYDSNHIKMKFHSAFHYVGIIMRCIYTNNICQLCKCFQRT